MGFLDEVGKVLDTVETATPIDIITGITGAVTDVPNLVGDVAQGNFGQAFVDGRKVLGDGTDIVLGLSSLGANLGPIPSFLENNTATKFTESKVLAAAQLLIDGMKKTTGSGTPCTGQEFRDSSTRLADVVETLIHAEPHADRWDGTGSQVYDATNASHRRLASDVQTADAEIAGHIDTEAGQVTRTRKTLDDTSESLTNYDLTTMWMNATPPTRALKFALDCTAAAGALNVSGATMAVLVKNSIENADRISKASKLYEDAAKDTSGTPLDACGTGEIFSVPDPEHQLPRPNNETPLPAPGEDNPPSRSLPDTQYTVPEPEDPPVQAPATPYGSPAPAAPR